MSTPTLKQPQLPQKMLTFLKKLNSKYPALSKLTQKQSQLFNNEVILLLVDQNQNVDQQAYHEVTSNIGIDAFVLDILGKCIDRNPVKNREEINRNICSIAEGLEKEVRDCGRRMRVAERREVEVGQREAGLRNRLKEYAILLEKQCLNKLISKQTQMKKTINSLLNNLRTKQKLIQDRREQLLTKLTEISHKQKSLTQRQRQLHKKSINPEISTTQATTDTSNHQISMNKGNGAKEMRELNKKYEECRGDLEKLRKKYKTTEMAYSKVKGDLANSVKDNQKLEAKIYQLKKQIQDLKGKHSQTQRQKPQAQPLLILQPRTKPAPKKSQKNEDLMDMLQMLQISQIQMESNFTKQKQKQNQSDNRNSGNFISDGKGKVVRKAGKEGSAGGEVVKRKSEEKGKKIEVYEDQSDQNEDSDEEHEREIPRQLGVKASQSHLYSDKSSQEQSFLALPNFLKQPPTSPSYSSTQILTKITKIAQNPPNSPNRSPTLTLIHQNLLLTFIKLPSFNHNKNNLTQFLDVLLTLIQQSNPQYYQLVQYLGQQYFTDFLQASYLNYESVLEITEATTLILSRIMMLTSVDVKFKEQFISAIKVRVKAIQNNPNTETNEQFLQGNINCLLSMIHS